MQILKRSWILLATLSCLTGDARALKIETVLVGNAGNGNDPATGYGSVASAYRIGKYEVTVGQYTEFLNSVAATDTYRLYNPGMTTDHFVAGIARSGVSGNYQYSVIGSANHPITFIDWGDAARFANWLHNGQPHGTQRAGTTETGAYTLNGAMGSSALIAIKRNSCATWFIPSEAEWYKAAYHQPAAQGGDSDDYWAYPMRTNSTPYSDQPPGVTPDNTRVGNFMADDGIANGYDDGLAVTGTMHVDPNQNYLTDAGAYKFSKSPYGTFDQGGNAQEWNETAIGRFRGLRGGTIDSLSAELQSSWRGGYYPAYEVDYIGFRVATCCSCYEPARRGRRHGRVVKITPSAPIAGPTNPVHEQTAPGLFKRERPDVPSAP